MDEDLLDILDVSKKLHLSRRHVYRLVRQGELRAIHIGSRIRIRPEEVRRFLRKRELEESPPEWLRNRRSQE